jgi:CelD/BcsL family acetyltransferase involved in cellulose biosynthesis
MIDVKRYSSFQELPESSVEVLEAASEESFFFSQPWFRTFVSHALDPGDRLFVYHAADADSGSPVAVLPVMHKSGNQSWWKPRTLSSLSSYYSSLFGPIAKRPIGEETAAAFARAIAEDRPRWDAIDIRPLDHQSPVFEALVRGLEQARFVVQTYFCFGNWFLDVNGRSFDEYVQSLPSTLRNTLTRKKKKLDKSGRARIEIICDDARLDDAIDSYQQVYNSSWKNEEPYPKFVPELIRTCARLGATRLGLLYVDNIPVAAQFWIVENRTAMIYKLAYDEKFADLSVGTILTAALMQHAIDIDKVTQVDYLTGDDAYKQGWMSGRRERWGILAMNPRTARGFLAVLRHVGGWAAKRAWKRVFGSQGKAQPAQRTGALSQETHVET